MRVRKLCAQQGTRRSGKARAGKRRTDPIVRMRFAERVMPIDPTAGPHTRSEFLEHSMSKKTTTNDRSSRRLPKPFLNKLGAMHTAEKELTLALPLIAAAAESKDLKTLLKIHLKQTKGHAKTLDKIAKELDQDLPLKGCPAIRRLIGRGVKVITKRLVSSEQDSALIDVGRQIEQYEIRSYKALCDAAKAGGLTHELALLTSVLHQEEMADELLGDLAAGRGPIKKLIENASLEHAGGRRRSSTSRGSARAVA